MYLQEEIKVYDYDTEDEAHAHASEMQKQGFSVLDIREVRGKQQAIYHKHYASIEKEENKCL